MATSEYIGDEGSSYPQSETSVNMARIVLLIHCPSIREGAKNEFGNYEIPVLDIGRKLRNFFGKSSQYQNIQFQLDVRAYIESLKANTEFASRRQRDKAHWEADFDSPNSDGTETLDIVHSRLGDKGLVVGLCLT